MKTENLKKRKKEKKRKERKEKVSCFFDNFDIF